MPLSIAPFGVDPAKAIDRTDEELEGLVDDFYCNAREDARQKLRDVLADDDSFMSLVMDQLLANRSGFYVNKSGRDIVKRMIADGDF